MPLGGCYSASAHVMSPLGKRLNPLCYCKTITIAHVRFRCCGGLRQRHVSTIEPAAAEMAAIWRESGMQGVTTIGLDIAKSVFQIHGVDAARGCLGWDITNVH